MKWSVYKTYSCKVNAPTNFHIDDGYDINEAYQIMSKGCSDCEYEVRECPEETKEKQ